MKQLDAINLIMPKLGERPVTSLEVRHPTLAVLLPIMDIKRRMILGRGWWFNQYEYTAYPSVAGKISLGSDTLSFVPYAQYTAAMRGTDLFNTSTLSYVFTDKVVGTITQDVGFDLLPESAAQHVLYASLEEAFATDLGVGDDLREWQVKAGQAWSDLLGEHLRQKKYNTRGTRNWRRLVRALQG